MTNEYKDPATIYRGEDVYLGDGLYMHYDGYMVALKAERANGVNWVGLEPAVLDRMLAELVKRGVMTMEVER